MVVRPYFTRDKKVLPFDKVIELERIDDWTFRSIVKAYSPTGKDRIWKYQLCIAATNTGD